MDLLQKGSGSLPFSQQEQPAMSKRPLHYKQKGILKLVLTCLPATRRRQRRSSHRCTDWNSPKAQGPHPAFNVVAKCSPASLAPTCLPADAHRSAGHDAGVALPDQPDTTLGLPNCLSKFDSVRLLLPRLPADAHQPARDDAGVYAAKPAGDHSRAGQPHPGIPAPGSHRAAGAARDPDAEQKVSNLLAFIVESTVTHFR